MLEGTREHYFKQNKPEEKTGGYYFKQNKSEKGQISNNLTHLWYLGRQNKGVNSI